jgi:COMPASS component SWD3
MAGASGKNEVKLFENEADFQIMSGVHGMKRGVYSVDYGNSSNKVAFGGGDGLVYFLNISHIG